jgi:hypothetical protein
MSRFPAQIHDSTVTSVSTRSAFLRHLNTNTLAFVLFVALALLSATRGKEPQNNESGHTRDTDPQLAIRPCNTSVSAW